MRPLEINDLINDIKSLHEKLCLLIENKELTNIEVVICSQELDKLLVKYEKNEFEVGNKYDKYN